MFKPGAQLTVNNATAVLRDGLAAIAGGQDSIDVSQVAVVDSSAVAILLAWRRAAQQRGMALELGALPANLKSLAELYGVTALLHGNAAAATSATDRHH